MGDVGIQTSENQKTCSKDGRPLRIIMLQWVIRSCIETEAVRSDFPSDSAAIGSERLALLAHTHFILMSLLPSALNKVGSLFMLQLKEPVVSTEHVDSPASAGHLPPAAQCTTHAPRTTCRAPHSLQRITHLQCSAPHNLPIHLRNPESRGVAVVLADVLQVIIPVKE